MSGATYEVSVRSESPWMSVSEAAEYAGVGAKQIRLLSRQGRLPFTQLHDRAWRLYRREDIDALLARHYHPVQEDEETAWRS